MPVAEITTALITLPPLLMLSGAVSGSETALFSLDHPGRARLAHTSPGAARAVSALLRHPRHLLSALLAMNMLINVSYYSISSVLVVGLEQQGATAAATTLAIASLAAMILIGEIAAKLLASAQTVLVCRAIASPWLLIIRLGWPIWNTLDQAVIRPLIRLASSPDAKTDPANRPTGDDIAAVLAVQHMTTDAEPADAAADQRLLSQIIRLRDQRARQAMRPRVEAETPPLDAQPERLDEAIRSEGRVLVLDPDTEAPIGWLSATRFLSQGSPTESHARRALLEPVLFLPEQATLDTVLNQLREGGHDRAAVVDEHGELAGVIRIEDVVAVFLEDAADQDQDLSTQPQLIALGTFSIPGRWPAAALLTDLDLPHDQADKLLSKVSTVGGLTLALLGKLPTQGDQLELPGATLTVTETAGRVVSRVEVRFHNASDAHTP